MKKKRLFNPLLIFLLGVISLILLFSNNSWWRFPTRGEIYSRIVFANSLIFIGNNQGEIFAIDNSKGQERWKFEAQGEITSGPFLYRDLVLFTSAGGELFILKAKSGELVWRFTNPDPFNFREPQISGGTVFVGDAGGSLYAINLGSGELKWKFTTGSVGSLKDILVDDRLNWFGDFKVVGNKIFLASRDGSLYALSVKTGGIEWKFDSQGSITTAPLLVGRSIFFGNIKGESFELNAKDGKLIAKNQETSAIICMDYFRKPFPEVGHYLIEVYEDGKIIKRQGGEKAWEIEIGEKKLFCPVSLNNILYLASSYGSIYALTTNDGKEIWSKDVGSIIDNFPITSYSLFQIDPLAGKIFIDTPFLYFGDGSGKFYALNAKDGKEIWQFSALTKINSRARIWGRFLYFVSSDGGLYKLRRFDGKIGKPLFVSFAPKVSQEIRKVGKSQVFEMTIKSPDLIFTNPLMQVKVTVNFTHESGQNLMIRGFYFDKNTWKVRFNPPKKGIWTWELSFEHPDRKYLSSGEFESQSDTAGMFVKISELNARRLSLDGKNIFSGLGIQGSTLDFNYNGNPFDDWAIGSSEPIVATSASGINYYFKSSDLIDLQTFLKTYGAEGGFNLYRWGFGNNAFVLWDWQVPSVDSKYSLDNAQKLDYFFESLRDNNFHIWLTLFNFNVPFGNSPWPIEKKLLENYVEYIVARYQAYVDIWEIANEAYPSEETVNMIVRKIKEQDFENRPISLSWERPEFSEINIISPHWYDTDNLSNSDLRTVYEIEKYKKFNKPVVFGEQGNKDKNWDETSALRMRVRAWTAFFNEAILIFWNTSEGKNFYNPLLQNANIFIGEEERAYLKIFQDFSKEVSLSASKHVLRQSNPSVRSYGLKSQNQLLGYFFHFAALGLSTSTTVSLDIPRGAVLTFIDPASGRELRTQIVPTAGLYQIETPSFKVDLALKVEFE